MILDTDQDDKKTPIEQTFKIDLLDLCRAGLFDGKSEGQLTWTSDQNNAAISYELTNNQLVFRYRVTRDGQVEDRHVHVRIQRTETMFDGLRAWLTCPDDICKRRCRILYLTRQGVLGCRVCLRLIYESERLAGSARWEWVLRPQRKIHRAQEELRRRRSPERLARARSNLEAGRRALLEGMRRCARVAC